MPFVFFIPSRSGRASSAVLDNSGDRGVLAELLSSEEVSGFSFFSFLLMNSMLIDTVKENIINRHAMNHTTFLST